MIMVNEHTHTHTFRPLVLVSTHSVLLVAVGPIGTGRQARKKTHNEQRTFITSRGFLPSHHFSLFFLLVVAQPPATAYYNWLRAVTPSSFWQSFGSLRSDSSFEFGYYAILSSYVVVQNKKAIICDPILFVWNNIGYTFER